MSDPITSNISTYHQIRREILNGQINQPLYTIDLFTAFSQVVSVQVFNGFLDNQDFQFIVYFVSRILNHKFKIIKELFTLYEQFQTAITSTNPYWIAVKAQLLLHVDC